MPDVEARAAGSAVAQDVAPATDLGGAVKEFQLQESGKPVRETMRGWTAPHKIVVAVDEPGRTAWLQQATSSVWVARGATACRAFSQTASKVTLPVRGETKM